MAALVLPARTTGTLALYIMTAILPLAVLIDRARGRNLFAGGPMDPLTKLFSVGCRTGRGDRRDLLWLGGRRSGGPAPCGRARPRGHRGLGACAGAAPRHRDLRVVVAAYLYSLAFMKKPGVPASIAAAG